MQYDYFEDTKDLEKVIRALSDAGGLLLERLTQHGSIDPVREEAPLEDMRNALSETHRILTNAPHDEGDEG